MRYISEKEIINVFDRYFEEKPITEDIETLLLSECKELNTWLPIDENTPKDRRLNLYWKGYGWFTGQWRMGQYFCDAGLMVPVNIKPTHYQELPPDPED